jgi:hypothetical protein
LTQYWLWVAQSTVAVAWRPSAAHVVITVDDVHSVTPAVQTHGEQVAVPDVSTQVVRFPHGTGERSALPSAAHEATEFPAQVDEPAVH